jgi:hypothetical protein
MHVSMRVKVCNFTSGMTIDRFWSMDAVVKEQSWSTLLLAGSVDPEETWIE